MKKLLILAFLIANPAFGEVVGTAIVDGRKVELYKDQTWSFADEATAGCKTLNKQIEFCGSADEWVRSPNTPAPVILAQYRRSAREYGQIIFESVGLDQGLNPAFMRKGILGNAGGASGQDPKDIPVIVTEPDEWQGRDGELMVYVVDFDGTDVAFANSYFVTRSQAVQIMTYVVGAADFTDAHRAMHSEFLAQMQLRDGAGE